ncbi:pyridoxal phosphate-dependent aminotransferase [Leucobacter tenebrionis]|uniref:pyridoxal phosphate-dependent aminotransferase n=1 Tax=Leucobacter tenebrionis TaxID=2873270 RepID=UPI001CA63FF0|nr:pyridoxal phosphate-dependent aminotransferase [Leucobacter tenebrionis]QZY53090.1 pyridoxal phosphate-dependent aminotransferase [Leucobacter tenebrionis]
MAHTQYPVSWLAGEYPASAIRAVFDRVAQFEGVTKLTVGEPDFDTPPHIVEAAVRSLRDGETRYSANAGIPAFRRAIAEHHGRRWARPLAEEQVMVAAGGMEALLLALGVVLDPGDEILIPDPAYPNYLGQVHMLGARPVRIPLSATDGFRLTADRIEPLIEARTKALIINSPSNPLGTVIPADELRRIAELADRRGLIIISDEVYDRVVFDGRAHVSIAQVDPAFERFLVVNSLSKSHAMTGWRAGYVIGSPRLIAPMPHMQEGISSCLPVFVQRAGIAALEGPEDATRAMVKSYQRRRDLLVRGITGIRGLDCAVPDGAFYLFVDVRGTGLSSEAFAERLLQEQRVAVIPGTAFGERGEGFVRISYAANEATLTAALAGIRAFVDDGAAHA